MCKFSASARNSISAQERMFRLAERDYALSLPILHAESGIPLNTLRGWKAGTTMPAWAIGALGDAGVPDYLLSLVLHPYRRHVGTDKADAATFHDAASEAAGFGSEYLDCTAPDSEMGQNLSPREKAKLGERAARAGGTLRAVAG